MLNIKYEGGNLLSDLWLPILASVISAAILYLISIIYKRVKCNVSKGFFKIAYRNVCVDYWSPDITNGPINEFDLSRPIPFRNMGNDVIILERYVVTVNGNITQKNSIKEIYQTEKNLSTKSLYLNLNEIDFSNRFLNVKILFDMKNKNGYKYSQILNYKFEKNNDFDIWYLIEADEYNFKKRW